MSGYNWRDPDCKIPGWEYTGTRKVNSWKVHMRDHQEGHKLWIYYHEPNLTCGTVDRSLVTRQLWEACAILAIFFCSEAMVFTKEPCQSLRGYSVWWESSFSRFQPPCQMFWSGVMQVWCQLNKGSSADRSNQYVSYM